MDERSDTGVLAFAHVLVLVLVLELGLSLSLLKRRLQRPDEIAAGSHATGSGAVVVMTQLSKASPYMSPDGVVGWAVEIRPPSHCSHALQYRHDFAH